MILVMALLRITLQKLAGQASENGLTKSRAGSWTGGSKIKAYLAFRLLTLDGNQGLEKRERT